MFSLLAISLISAFQSTSSDNRGIWLPLVAHARCSSRQELLSNETLCSELPEGVTSLLSGDTGAGLGLEVEGRFVVAGVLIQTVSHQEGPSYGVYTRVTQYQHWISETVQQHREYSIFTITTKKKKTTSYQQEHLFALQYVCCSKIKWIA